MRIGDVCSRNVVCATRDTTVAAAANLMRDSNVGDVVVIDRADAERMPIGIVTDRDIVVKVVAPGLDPKTSTLGDLMSWGKLRTAQATDNYVDTLHSMHVEGVRRMPVVDAAGVLVGIISVDDILPRFATELSELAELLERGRERERRTHASPIGN